jgi:hypothetical protein
MSEAALSFDGVDFQFKLSQNRGMVSSSGESEA